jgi:hypothetical protein
LYCKRALTMPTTAQNQALYCSFALMLPIPPS